MHPVMWALLGFGVIAELAIFAGIIAAIVSDANPFRLQLFHLWVFAALLGLFNLRLIIVGIRLIRGRGAFVRIDDTGVTNIKDGIGPIPWRDVRDASIRELPRVPRIGTRHSLFVDVADKTSGVRSIAVMSSPPHQLTALEQALEQIRTRCRKAS